MDCILYMRMFPLSADAIAFDLVKSGAVEALVSTYKAYTDYRYNDTYINVHA